MLVQRILRVFPFFCKDQLPLCGSTPAAYRIANRRMAFFGRRSRAVTTSPGYILPATLKPTAFTSAQLREVVPTMAFLVAYLFCLGRRRSAPGAPSAGSGPTTAGSSRGRRQAAAAHSAPGVDADEELFEPTVRIPKSRCPPTIVDWAAYKEVFDETPLEDAITAMFAEYAVLYSRIFGWTTPPASPPTLLDVA